MLEEFQKLAGNSDAASEARKNEIMKWMEDHRSPENDAAGRKKMDEWLSELKTDVEDIKQEALRQQLDDKAYKLIPWSYIAKEYFGKSVAWLTQRINGYPVRGKVYTLNEKQKTTLNQALEDIGKFIGSYRIA